MKILKLLDLYCKAGGLHKVYRKTIFKAMKKTFCINGNVCMFEQEKQE